MLFGTFIWLEIYARRNEPSRVPATSAVAMAIDEVDLYDNEFVSEGVGAKVYKKTSCLITMSTT
jgi:hypothetical protein